MFPPGLRLPFEVVCILSMERVSKETHFLPIKKQQAEIAGGSDGRESACNAGDLGLILGLGRFAGEGNSYPLQYSCLENSMDRGTWQATVHRVPKSWTWLNDFHFHFSVESSMAMSLKNEHSIVI